MHDDGVFNDCQRSDQEFDDEIASIDSQTNVMDHSESNDIIDSQLNSKDNDDFKLGGTLVYFCRD